MSNLYFFVIVSSKAGLFGRFWDHFLRLIRGYVVDRVLAVLVYLGKCIDPSHNAFSISITHWIRISVAGSESRVYSSGSTTTSSTQIYRESLSMWTCSVRSIFPTVISNFIVFFSLSEFIHSFFNKLQEIISVRLS